MFIQTNNKKHVFANVFLIDIFLVVFWQKYIWGTVE